MRYEYKKEIIRFFFYLLVGFVLGVAISELCGDPIESDFAVVERQVRREVTKVPKDDPSYGFYIVSQKTREVFVLWLCSCTKFFYAISGMYLFQAGLKKGMFLGMLFRCFGWKSIVMFLVYDFPQGMLYLVGGYLMVFSCSQIKKSRAKGKNGIVVAVGVPIMFVVLGAWAEITINLWLYNKLM